MLRSAYIGLAAALLAGGALLATGPAAAHERETTHEGYGVLVVEGRHPISAGAIHYVVRVTWSADQHPATSTANVTATAISPLGVPSTPVALQPLDYDGRYGGTVVFPSDGAWVVRFTSTTPPGTVDVNEAVALTLPVATT